VPVARDQLTQRLPMGATVKCLALYARPFWRDRGLSGEAVCHGGPVCVVFDNTTSDGAQPALLAFVVGDPARGWAARPAAERRALVLSTFARLFGPEALEAEGYEELDWSAEEWTRGCPVANAGPGVWTSAGDALRAPIGRLHFAGTETAHEWNGYMEGALEAGTRAAREILARL
jgi:monoamine oxidase